MIFWRENIEPPELVAVWKSLDLGGDLDPWGRQVASMAVAGSHAWWMVLDGSRLRAGPLMVNK